MPRIKDYPIGHNTAPKPGRKLIVFVHGILSEVSTFHDMADKMMRAQILTGYSYSYFNYDYNQPLKENGQALADALATACGDDEDVTLVAHSMGGLVSRLAVLSRDLPCVKRLVMLGTPNHGAIRTAQLAILARLTVKMTNLIYGVFSRKRGILDLTRVPDVFRDHVENHAARADQVLYMTIPGLYFNEGRAGTPSTRDRARQMFKTMDIAAEVAAGLFPLFAAKMHPPHDGIVEEVSNQLESPHRSHAGRRHEKMPVMPLLTEKSTYVHLSLAACDDLHHVNLHHNSYVTRVVSAFIAGGITGLTGALGRLDATYPA